MHRMGHRAVIFVPMDGYRYAERYREQCQALCHERDVDVVAVTHNPANVAVMAAMDLFDILVVARYRHLQWLTPYDLSVVEGDRPRRSPPQPRRPAAEDRSE